MESYSEIIENIPTELISYGEIPSLNIDQLTSGQSIYGQFSKPYYSDLDDSVNFISHANGVLAPPASPLTSYGEVSGQTYSNLQKLNLRNTLSETNLDDSVDSDYPKKETRTIPSLWTNKVGDDTDTLSIGQTYFGQYLVEIEDRTI